MSMAYLVGQGVVVANCRDIFFPVPFPPSPFGFRRSKLGFSNEGLARLRPERVEQGLDKEWEAGWARIECRGLDS